MKNLTEKLEGLRLELLKLRAMLIPQEDPSPDEIEEIKKTKEEIRRGESIPLKALLEELGE